MGAVIPCHCPPLGKIIAAHMDGLENGLPGKKNQQTSKYELGVTVHVYGASYLGG
jgi:hypothetical protein